jgi:hypothetical protein
LKGSVKVTKLNKKDQPEVILDESYVKLSKLTSRKLTKSKLEKFMKENPGLIAGVTAKEARSAQKRLEKFMKSDPIGRQILENNKQLLKNPVERKSNA